MNPNTVVVYEGPSSFTGDPVVVLLSGLKRPSLNPKTGPMLPVYTLLRNANPLMARHTGADTAVCGTCPLRAACYVQLGQAPAGMYKAYQAGQYELVTLQKASWLTAGRRVRLGAYGDPGAVPETVCEALVREAAGFTGYTHSWRLPRAKYLKDYCHASVETAADAAIAQAAGWRTFRVRPDGDTSRSKGEVLCPAASRPGKVSCFSCLRCRGVSGGNVTIPAHGAGRRRVA